MPSVRSVMPVMYWLLSVPETGPLPVLLREMLVEAGFEIKQTLVALADLAVDLGELLADRVGLVVPLVEQEAAKEQRCHHRVGALLFEVGHPAFHFLNLLVVVHTSYKGRLRPNLCKTCATLFHMARLCQLSPSSGSSLSRYSLLS